MHGWKAQVGQPQGSGEKSTESRHVRLVSRTLHHFPSVASHGEEDGITWLYDGSQRMRVHSTHRRNVLKRGIG